MLQIRLRRLRKLGVSSASEKSDESGNHKTSKSDDLSIDNNSAQQEKTETSILTPSSLSSKEDNKKVIISGQIMIGNFKKFKQI